MTIGIIANPRKLHRVRNLGHLVQRHRPVIPEIPLVEKATSSLYEEPLKRILDAGATQLVIIGGDGTAHLVDTALERIAPHINLPQAHINGGTMNVRRISSGLPNKTPEYFLERLLMNQGPVDTVERTLLRIETEDTVYVGFSYVTGLVGNVLDEYYNGWANAVEVAWIVGKAGASHLTKWINPLAQRYLHRVLRPVYLDATLNAMTYCGEQGALVVTSLDINLPLGPFHLHPEFLQGTNERTDFRVLRLSAKDTRAHALLWQALNATTIRGTGPGPKTIPGLDVQDTSVLKLSLPQDHTFYIDAEPYMTRTNIILTPLHQQRRYVTGIQ